ncbi:MAG: hypothetical protein NZ841_08485 [Dictyoglomus sp.]|nr:hypothetical protein [Dictyoglomus sp.]MDW8189319.1 hypothetical protein [Dictyoglomus sp.]
MATRIERKKRFYNEVSLTGTELSKLQNFKNLLFFNFISGYPSPSTKYTGN